MKERIMLDVDALTGLLPDKIKVAFEYNGKSVEIAINRDVLKSIISATKNYLIQSGAEVDLPMIVGMAGTIWKIIKEKGIAVEDSGGQGIG